MGENMVEGDTYRTMEDSNISKYWEREGEIRKKKLLKGSTAHSNCRLDIFLKRCIVLQDGFNFFKKWKLKDKLKNMYEYWQHKDSQVSVRVRAAAGCGAGWALQKGTTTQGAHSTSQTSSFTYLFWQYSSRWQCLEKGHFYKIYNGPLASTWPKKHWMS